MNFARTIEPEWLDELPPDDARAMRSRRDLRRINALMRNSTLVARELRRVHATTPPRLIAEIGAGDGDFMLRVARRLAPRWRAAEVVLLDQQNVVSAATHADIAAIGWQARVVTADVFSWLAQHEGPVFDLIVANLFLHHFDAARLGALLSLLATRTRVLVACEPRRSRRALFASYLLGVAGCNDVSRHDAVVSVRAGFGGGELSVLWPDDAAWTLREYAGGLFSHCFVAVRAVPNDDARRDFRP